MKHLKRTQDSNIPIAEKKPNKAENFTNFLHEDMMNAFRQYELSQLNLDKDKDKPNDMPNGLEEKLDSISEKIKKDMLEMENRLI